MPISPTPQPLDDGQLRRALTEANLPALLMVLFQLTGDRAWLEEPFRPSRTKGMADNDSGGFPDEIRDVIREAAAQAIHEWSAGKPAATPAPRGELLMELMSTCMGEPVPAEYEPMLAEEMGFEQPVEPSPVAADADFSVVIIGAGVSGMTAALALKRAGIQHVVLEKNQEVGGTWLENRYPGCGVDTPSYLYSFSFFPRQWSTHFGKRPELAAYMHDVARAFDLHASIRFGTEVLSAEYDEQAQRWRVLTQDSAGNRAELVANAVITAVGQLNRPKMPRLPGMDLFRGPLFHSARWPEDLDITGKKVVVIGTGASAMQIVPAIADQVGALTVVQRSPQWVAPNGNYFKPVGDGIHWLMEHVPYYHSWVRFRLAWLNNDKVHASLQRDPDWPHQERSLNAVNDGHRSFFTRYITEQLADRDDLLEKVLPDYPPFGKRMLLDNGWYAALKKPTVELVTDGVAEVTERGVRTSSGREIEADVLVFATGFEAQRLLHPLEVRGRGGMSVRDVWGDDDASAYLGITTPGFPNFFMIYGPNTNIVVNGSIIFFSECAVRYIVGCLRLLAESGARAMELKKDVHDDFNVRVDEANKGWAWGSPNVTSWYKNEFGRVSQNWPFGLIDYWRATLAPNPDDFVLERQAEPVA